MPCSRSCSRIQRNASGKAQTRSSWSRAEYYRVEQLHSLSARIVSNANMVNLKRNANRLRSVASDLGQDFLSVYHRKDARLKG